MAMIYCNLSNHRSVTLSAPKLFAGSVTNASGSFAYAMEHPIQNIPVTTAGSLGNNPAHANQGIWLGSNDLAGKDSVLVPGLVSCAAVLFYDINFVLIGAGHAAGGFIDNEIMTQITNTICSGDVQYIVYATPTLMGETTGSYADSLGELEKKWDTRRICFIDSFAYPSMGMVIADMTGNISFQ